MNRNIGALLRPLVAIALFALLVWQTRGALEASGAWSGGHKPPAISAVDPFVGLDRTIAEAGTPPPGSMRDPFGLGASPTPPASGGAGKPRVAVRPAAPAQPVLTAIVWDADPRALVRWQGREYTVHSGGLFGEFQVVGITRDQVVLKRGSEDIVLQRKPQGE